MISTADLSQIAIIIVALTTCANTTIGLVTLWLTRKVELQTNSMKDALVAATRSDALQKGHVAGVAAQKVEQAIINDDLLKKQG